MIERVAMVCVAVLAGMFLLMGLIRLTGCYSIEVMHSYRVVQRDGHVERVIAARASWGSMGGHALLSFEDSLHVRRVYVDPLQVTEER